MTTSFQILGLTVVLTATQNHHPLRVSVRVAVLSNSGSFDPPMPYTQCDIGDNITSSPSSFLLFSDLSGLLKAPPKICMMSFYASTSQPYSITTLHCLSQSSSDHVLKIHRVFETLSPHLWRMIGRFEGCLISAVICLGGSGRIRPLGEW